MLAGHVLKVANSPAFRGRDPESSLRTAMLRLGLKNLGEVVFELALHMRVFRSADYSQAMEDLRRHSTACASLSRMLAARTGHDPENAFLCGLLHDIGIAGILIVLGENRLSEKALEPHILDEVVRQTHEEVSGMLVQLWKLPVEVAQVVAKHHQTATDPDIPRLSAVIALADMLTVKLGFAVDLGVGPLDGVDTEAVATICTKLGIASEVMPTIEAEAALVLRAVAKTLDHTKVSDEEKPAGESKSAPTTTAVKPSKPAPALSARKKEKSLWARLRQALFG
jgi:putative nucleotidyltransferase with HDIG domain